MVLDYHSWSQVFCFVSRVNIMEGNTAPLQQPQIKGHYEKWWRKPSTRSGEINNFCLVSSLERCKTNKRDGVLSSPGLCRSPFQDNLDPQSHRQARWVQDTDLTTWSTPEVRVWMSRFQHRQWFWARTFLWKRNQFKPDTTVCSFSAVARVPRQAQQGKQAASCTLGQSAEQWLLLVRRTGIKTSCLWT